MMKINILDGFEIEVDERRLDNMELVDALAEMSNSNPLQISEVSRLILGKEERKKIYDHIRTEDGRVPVPDVEKILIEIFKACGNQGKNS